MPGLVPSSTFIRSLRWSCECGSSKLRWRFCSNTVICTQDSSPMRTPRKTKLQSKPQPSWRLRWAGVIPSAMVAGWVGYQLGGAAIIFRGSYFPPILFPLLLLLPAGFLFTFFGSWVAPQFRTIVAILLALACGSLSIYVHVLAQPAPDISNHAHAVGECTGALLGIYAITRFGRVC